MHQAVAGNSIKAVHSKYYASNTKRALLQFIQGPKGHK